MRIPHIRLYIIYLIGRCRFRPMEPGDSAGGLPRSRPRRLDSGGRSADAWPSMRLISRSVLKEIWPPFLLGFAAYTFILLVRTIFMMTEFFVRRSASFGEVASLVLL